MNNRTALLTALVLVILIGALVAARRHGSSSSSTTATTQASSSASPVAQSSPTPSGSLQPTSQYVVTYTDSGFSPSTITVPNGATVQFKNAASDNVRVASNPHPTHTDYPGFDALRDYAPGQTYSFTFTKSGSWGYHNHLNPSEGGTVVVQ